MLRCLRIDLRRFFSRYVDANLPARIEKRLEDHLLDCVECRARLARVRAGDRMARQAPFFRPLHDPWIAIRAAIERPASVPARFSFEPRLRAYGRHVEKNRLAGLALVLAIALFGWLAWSRQYAPSEATRALWPLASIEQDQFHEVSIAAIENNSEPHIVVKGYVAEVRFNIEENDLSFKLVEDLSQPRPFIICEIIGPTRLTLPQVGSRVRVYGVSRYDGQPGHKWYEVHPVMKIEIISQ